LFATLFVEHISYARRESVFISDRARAGCTYKGVFCKCFFIW